MNLILVTNNFPADGGDSVFIKTEWQELCKSFEKIVIISRSKKHDISINLPKNVEVFWYKVSLKNIYLLLQAFLDYELLCEIWKSCKKCCLKNKIKRIKMIIKMWYVQKDFEKFFVKNKLGFSEKTICYTYWISSITFFFTKLKQKNGNYKVISRTHGMDLYNERVPGGYQPFRNTLANELDGLYFVSQIGKEYFFNHWGNSCNKVQKVMHLGTEKRKRIYNKDLKTKLVLVSCSNMISLKRIDLIIMALAKIPYEIQVEWHHIGDGNLRNKLEEIAHKQLDMKKNVTWKYWGQQLNEEIENIYHRVGADLFITTSSTEGSPISLQEAFSMGIPAIGTAVGGIPEMINESTGYLLGANPSAEEIQDAICKYANIEWSVRKEMSDCAYQMWKDKFCAEQNANIFVQEILNL